MHPEPRILQGCIGVPFFSMNKDLPRDTLPFMYEWLKDLITWRVEAAERAGEKKEIDDDELDAWKLMHGETRKLPELSEEERSKGFKDMLTEST